MATPEGEDGGYPYKRFNAKYRCKHCQETWKTKNTGHLSMVCKNRDCRQTVRVYKFEVINKLVVYQCKKCFNKIKKVKCSSEVKELPYCTICHNPQMEVLLLKNLWNKRRMFGHFHCGQCKNEWRSGYAWDGVGQDCRLCNIMVLPYLLKPLQFNPATSNKGQPHRQDLCEMCKQLGHSCKDYKPKGEDVAMMDEIPLEHDNQSVITTNSSIVGDGDDDNDEDTDSTGGGDRTPVNSDSDPEDQPADEVEKLFQKMKLNK